MIESMEQNDSMYCPICEACGHEGCCTPLICMQDPKGDYCEGYLVDLKFTWRMHHRLLKKMDEEPEKYADILKWYDEMYGTGN